MPEHLWLARELEADSFASDLRSAAPDTKRQGKMPAEVWFDGVPDDKYDLQEYSVRMKEGIYTLLYLTDEGLIEERMSSKRQWKMHE